jgi:hypothetical protein
MLATSEEERTTGLEERSANGLTMSAAIVNNGKTTKKNRMG